MDELLYMIDASFARSNIRLTAEQKVQFQIYCEFLLEYNQKVNLTAITQKQEIIDSVNAEAKARENEIKTVKIIMSGKLNGFDNDFIKERVREMYA